MDERWRRVIAAPLAFVIALLSALTILGAFAPKAYAATSEPTGLQAYIDAKPYSNFKVSDGANEAGFYSIESGSLEMKGLPEGWNYYYFDTFKQDDGTLTAGIGVTNGDSDTTGALSGCLNLYNPLIASRISDLPTLTQADQN